MAARGLDIEGLAMVVNYDLPNEAENYVHRIGRTARAGKTGRAITLVSEQDVYELPAIERYIGKKLPSEIASEDLHADDASAGQQIRTELYEDRREERHVHGKGIKPHTQGKSARRGEGRHGETRHGESRHGGGKAPGHKPQDGQKPVSKQPGSRPKDVSHLSFDERKALYKQKYYKGDKAAPAGQKPHSQKPSGAQKPPRHKPAPVGQKPRQIPEQKPAKKGIFSKLLKKIGIGK